ncbi:Protein transport protein [Yarrowia sp. B02]|nr:Protein transport protein [Yarrowia sp. B02]
MSNLDPLIETCLSLISRLQRFGTHSLASRDVRQELADLIQTKLRDLDSEFARYKATCPRDTASQIVLESYTEQIANLRVLYRKAQVTSAKNVEKSLLKERQMLFEGRKEVKEEASEKAVLNKSRDITESLKRVHQMASQNVLRGEMHLESLDQSSRDMQMLQQKYTTFDVLLAGSKKLVRHLEQADKQDRILMMASLGFLALVVAWILYRRVLKLPLMILTWPLLKLFGIVRGSGPKMPKNPNNPAEALVDTLVDTLVEATPSVSIDTLVETLVETLETAVASSAAADIDLEIPVVSEPLDETLPDSGAPIRDEL